MKTTRKFPAYVVGWFTVAFFLLVLTNCSYQTKNQESASDMAYTANKAPKSPDETPDQTESYQHLSENHFVNARQEPVSTFSVDVDAASYSNARRYIQQGQLPPPDAVRIEELINYFTYQYPQPTGPIPFSVYTEIAPCPWNPAHQLVHIGLQGKNLPTAAWPPSNLVFLIDVSGSMSDQNKLPLLKKAFALLVANVREADRVAIVVYAGAAGLVLPATPGSDKRRLMDALERLEAGGSTAGGKGIALAYQVARENWIPGGNNRIILATDGDFNMGPSSDQAMVELIEQKRKQGIFLTVLGFGMGNYKDSKMEALADHGNGNYYYIDNLNEGKKVLSTELGSTLFTIAKDVKIQVAFNADQVKTYRLIGYENRMLSRQDFTDDTKDAGEIGAGHQVTALYEVELRDNKQEDGKMLDGKMLTVQLRYKEPASDASQLVAQPLNRAISGPTSDDFRFSAAVASFGMLLRHSEYRGNSTYESVLELARNATGVDKEGYRAEFIELVEAAREIKAL